MSLRFAVRFFASILASAAALALVAACQQQGEGQPCDVNAGNGGNNDCQSGLVCRNIPTVGTRCCPATGPSSSQDCNGSTNNADGSPPPTSDATTQDVTSDAPGEASPEAASFEAGADAADAAVEGATPDAEGGTSGDALSDVASGG